MIQTLDTETALRNSQKFARRLGETQSTREALELRRFTDIAEERAAVTSRALELAKNTSDLDHIVEVLARGAIIENRALILRVFARADEFERK